MNNANVTQKLKKYIYGDALADFKKKRNKQKSQLL